MNIFKFIDTDEAITKIEKKESIVVDIRDKDSFNGGHIDGAFNLSNENIEAFIRDTKKEQSIIVCCYHGNSSQRASKFLTQKGFTDVYSLNGGYKMWKNQKNK